MKLFDLTGEIAVVIGATGVLGGALAALFWSLFVRFRSVFVDFSPTQSAQRLAGPMVAEERGTP